MDNTGWIFINGVGDDLTENFSKKFTDEIILRTNKPKFYTINWQEEVQDYQDDLVLKNDLLKYKNFRKLISSYAADALTYYCGSDPYVNIHKQIHEVINNARLDGVQNLVIVAHSLGSIIVMNYLWDIINSDSNGNIYFKSSNENSKFLIRSLRYVFTIGSPIAIWSGQYKNGGVPLDLKKFFNLLYHVNIYSKYDIISWPIKNINSLYLNQNKILDYNINYGSLIYKYTPISHICVWKDKKIIGYIISRVLDR